MKKAIICCALFFGCQYQSRSEGNNVVDEKKSQETTSTNSKTEDNATSSSTGSSKNNSDDIDNIKSAVVSCVPGETFCKLNIRWQCNLSGIDASSPVNCTDFGSKTNPSTCVNGSCKLEKPVCTISLNSYKDEVNVSYGVAKGPLKSCGFTKDCNTNSIRLIYIDGSSIETTDKTCSQSSTYDTIQITSSTPFSVGVSQDISKISFAYSVNGVSCSSWTGTIVLDKDIPSWKISINAVCAEKDKSSIKINGSIFGEN